MKKLAVLVAILPAVFGCEAIWNNGPTQLLRDIFEISEIDNVDDLKFVTQQANFRWIRPKGYERWHIYSILNDSQREKLTKIIKKSALAKAKMPTKKHYHAVVVLGATTARVKNRMEFLMQLANHGVTWDKVFLLGSTRDLNVGTEQDQRMAIFLKKMGSAETEMFMMQYLWSQINKPKFCASIPVISIQSGNRADGTRANTEDSLVEMAKNIDSAQGKNILFISNNPYICYQDAVAKKILNSFGVSVETVGEGMSSEESMENVLDTVAKCLTKMN